MYLFLIFTILFLSVEDLCSSESINKNIECGIYVGNNKNLEAYVFTRNQQKKAEYPVILEKQLIKGINSSANVTAEVITNDTLTSKTKTLGPTDVRCHYSGPPVYSNLTHYYLVPCNAESMQQLFNRVIGGKTITLFTADVETPGYHPQAKAMKDFCKQKHEGKPLIDYLCYVPNVTNYIKKLTPREEFLLKVFNENTHPIEAFNNAAQKQNKDRYNMLRNLTFYFIPFLMFTGGYLQMEKTTLSIGALYLSLLYTVHHTLSYCPLAK